MAHEAPGKHYRKGITLLDVAEMFGDEEKARAWVAEQRWPDGPYCTALRNRLNVHVGDSSTRP